MAVGGLYGSNLYTGITKTGVHTLCDKNLQLFVIHSIPSKSEINVIPINMEQNPTNIDMWANKSRIKEIFNGKLATVKYQAGKIIFGIHKNQFPELVNTGRQINLISGDKKIPLGIIALYNRLGFEVKATGRYTGSYMRRWSTFEQYILKQRNTYPKFFSAYQSYLERKSYTSN